MDIAVIGMAGRFPGAGNINEFWDNLKNGKESISFFSDKELEEAGVDEKWLNDPLYVKAFGYFEGKEYFDSFFFGYSHKDAEMMDPQIRVFHECAWEALEDAGYNVESYPGRIGLCAGATNSFNWQAMSHLSGKSESIGAFAAQQLTDKDFLCSRVSYNFNLKGASSIVQTACSTSLVAVHYGCRALITGESDMIMAGGVTISPNLKQGYVYQEGMIASPDGHCRAFDAKAGGTVGG
jgi:phthiocerol/phenolphthiocerol synthesis type-I polyketide synthase E